MSYDPKTRKIHIEAGTDAFQGLMADMGVHFVSTVLKIGSMPTASKDLAYDAAALRNWLCLRSDELPDSAMERIRLAWTAYTRVRGITEPASRSEAAEALNDMPPKAIQQVFDRMVGMHP